MKGFWSALALLTRLPVPARAAAAGGVDLAGSIVFFPAAGALIGIILVGVARVGASPGLGFPLLVQAALLLTTWVGLTGALHLDGFMDTVDGLSSRRSRDEALAIMRDPRVGGMAVVAACLLLCWKLVLIHSLLAARELTAILLLVPVWSRWAMALAVVSFPYARSSGMGRDFRALGRRTRAVKVAGATALAALPAVASAAVQGMPPVVAVALPAAAALTSLAFGRVWSVRLGGLTGDTYGALNELAEVVLLLVAVIFRG